ncbi:MAG: carboxypeptidase regulatory-like domain-containing protein [Acidobacteriota bacterium]
MMSLLRTAMTSMGCLMLALPLEAGTVEGRVSLSDQFLKNALVSVTDLAGSPGNRPPVSLDHQSPAFRPRVLAILRGTPVRFVLGKMPCRLYSISEEGRFNLSRQKGRLKSIQFDRPGVIQVRCEDHPSALAYIVVLANPYFALTSETGRYSIVGVPEGTHRIEVWFEGEVRERRTVRVEDGTRLDFRLRPPDDGSNQDHKSESAAVSALTLKDSLASALPDLERDETESGLTPTASSSGPDVDVGPAGFNRVWEKRTQNWRKP